MKKIILSLLLVSFSLVAFSVETTEKITKVDRDELFKKFNFPRYVVPLNELRKLTFEESSKALKEDIYKYVKDVEAMYMTETKSPISLLLPSATIAKIDKSVDETYHSLDQLSDPSFSEIVTESTKKYFLTVQEQNRYPTIAVINDLYAETLSLKKRVHDLESELAGKKPTISSSGEDNMNMMLTYAALGLSGLALIASVFMGRNGKKKK